MLVYTSTDGEPIYAGITLNVRVANGWHPGKVLAVRGDKDEALIEYVMPRYSALRILDLAQLQRGEERDRSISYGRLSKKWQEAVIEGKQAMVGTPLRRRISANGKPSEIL